MHPVLEGVAVAIALWLTVHLLTIKPKTIPAHIRLAAWHRPSKRVVIARSTHIWQIMCHRCSFLTANIRYKEITCNPIALLINTKK